MEVGGGVAAHPQVELGIAGVIDKGPKGGEVIKSIVNRMKCI